MINELKLLCWNVHFNTFAVDNSYVLEVLDSLDEPDVLCLQEFVGGKDDAVRQWLKSHDYTISYLPFASFPKDKKISQGVMTATKKHLKASVTPVLLREDSPRLFRNFPNVRGLLDCRIKLDGKEMIILNFHATLPRHYTTDMRRREFAALVEHLDKLDSDSALFLCGDFNFFGRDPRKKYLKARHASFTGTHSEPTWRFKSKILPLKANLDYLFWTENNLHVDAQLLPFNTSDHRPISAKLV